MGSCGGRSSDGSGFWIKASNLGLEEVEYDDILLVAWDGTVLQGTGHRSAEYPIHARIMLGRPELAAMSAGGPRVWTSTEEALVKRSHAYPRPL